MDTKIRFVVEPDFVERGVAELAAMLLRQERGFADRWNAHAATRWTVSVLRIIGLALALIATVVCLWAATYPAERWMWIGFASVFAAFSVLFLLIPRIQRGVRAWGFRRSEARSRRRAAKILRPPAKLAPFEAEYDVRGDLLTYARGKDGKWNHLWDRKLMKFKNGIALQGSVVTAIFSKPRAFLPAILILHADRKWVDAMLDELGIARDEISVTNDGLP